METNAISKWIDLHKLTHTSRQIKNWKRKTLLPQKRFQTFVQALGIQLGTIRLGCAIKDLG